MKIFLLLCGLGLVLAVPSRGEAELPVRGIAHVTLAASNPEVSRVHYTGMLGFERTFASDEGGGALYLKINDDQFVKLSGRPGGMDVGGLVEVALEVPDASDVHARLHELGLTPIAVALRADGTRATTVRDPDGHLIAFVEYAVDSRQTRARGQHLGARRVSDRLHQVGLVVADEGRARAFYEERLGGRVVQRGGSDGPSAAWLRIRLPGERGDCVELTVLEGAAANGGTSAAVQHIGLETQDLRASHRAMTRQGLQDIERYHPHIGRDGHWVSHVFGPDGTRIELRESRPVPALERAAPGAEPRFYGAGLGALAAAKQRLETGDAALQPALDRLLLDAAAALQVEPPSVTHKTRPAASGNLHDYATQAPFLWPDPGSATGLPYVPRDGVVNPESRDPANSDHARVGLLGRTVETLALAYYFTGDDAYASHAAKCLRVWFVDPSTRMTPHMEYAQAVPGRNVGRGIGLIEAGGLVSAADAAGLLDGSPAWTRDDRVGLQTWVGNFLDWMLHSGHGRYEDDMRQNHGTMFDVRATRLALISGRDDVAKRILAAVPARRIVRQIEPDGAQPMELRRTNGLSYSRLNLSGLVTLAGLGDRFDLDLWNFRTPDGRSIRQALDFILPYVQDVTRPWPYEQITPFDRSNWAATYREAALAYLDDRYEAVVTGFSSIGDVRFQLMNPPPRREP